MTKKLSRPVSIIGTSTLGQRYFDDPEYEGLSIYELWAYACHQAMQDAGVKPKDIDKVVYAHMANFQTGGNVLAPVGSMMEWVGLRGKPIVHIEQACGSDYMAFVEACDAVASGKYDVVMIAGFESPKHFIPREQPAFRIKLIKVRPILKPYYEALEERKILGMKCPDCGDVTWPPLPICQECGSTGVDWIEMGNEAVIEEIRFEDSSVGGDYTFRKANDFFEDRETPYCICIGKFPTGTHKFHAALYGINEDNLAEWKSGLPFIAPVRFIEMAGKFKSVGFKLPKR